MTSESQQEQAALYALGLLDADEAAAFEREIGENPDLSELVRELRETSALLALAGEGWSTVAAPPALRDRVLAEARAHEQHSTALLSVAEKQTGVAETSTPARTAWLPWALAALLMGCSALQLWFRQHQDRKIAFLTEMIKKDSRYASTDGNPTPAPFPADALAQVSFCALEPTPDFATAQPRAAVLWDAAHRQGKLRVNRLAPPAQGKDYQLWTVEAGRKDAVSAGVVHVDADGRADLPFQPVDADGKPVVAVAISLEQAGGSPTNQGPILLLGKF